MRQESAILGFPRSLVGDPMISRLLRAFPVEVNILHARIDQKEEGRLFAVFSGEDPVVGEALDYLRTSGVQVIIPESDFIWDSDLCVHCGACAGLCPSGAFSIDPDSFEVRFDLGKCIACDLCIDGCYYGAIETIEEYIARAGGE